MDKKNVIICYKHSAQLEANFQSSEETTLNTRTTSTANKLPGFSVDKEYAPVAVPEFAASELEEFQEFDVEADTRNVSDLSKSTYIVRGTVDGDKLKKFVEAANKDSKVYGVYSDPVINHFRVCPSSAIGNSSDVENRLGVQALRSCEMTGEGVTVAIVDSGINADHLRAAGKTPRLNLADSWKPATTPAGRQPGSMPVGHGTMVAYDVLIAAPDCTLLDIALLQSNAQGQTAMSGFLSDAIKAYRHLMDVMTRNTEIGKNKSLVVNNSWGMFHPSWDFPVGHAGNYSDNENHPFNIIVKSLERMGADILFAAGNCGVDCPDGRCQDETTATIYGANSSPYVLTVAGVSINHDRLGYSSIGPGRLQTKKPDLSGYTHFKGSGVYAADGGTSAATPVIAGVVAAIRNKIPLNLSDSQTRPAAIRNLLTSTATDLGISGYDLRHGFGVVNTVKIREKICPPVIVNICDRYPQLCNFCKFNPRVCEALRKWGLPRFQEIPIQTATQTVPVRQQHFGPMAMDSGAYTNGNYSPVPSASSPQYSDEFLMGMEFALSMQESGGTFPIQQQAVKSGDCNCHKH